MFRGWNIITPHPPLRAWCSVYLVGENPTFSVPTLKGCDTFGVMLTAMNTVEEGDITIFFAKDLGLAVEPKKCPDQSQVFKEVNNSQAFSVPFFLFYPFFF